MYPEATETSCTAALIVDVDPVGLVRDRRVRPATTSRCPVRERPALRGVVVSLGCHRQGLRHGDERPEQGAAGAGRHADPARGPPAGRARAGAARRCCAACSSRSATTSPPSRSRSTPRFPTGETAATSTSTLSGTVRLKDLLEHLFVLLPGARRRQALLGRPGRGRQAAAPRRGLAVGAPRPRADHPALPAPRPAAHREALARLMEDDPTTPTTAEAARRRGGGGRASRSA